MRRVCFSLLTGSVRRLSVSARGLFLLAEEAEAFLAVALLALLAAHGHPAGLPRAGGDGGHGHGPRQDFGAHRGVFPRSALPRLDGRADGLDPGAHLGLGDRERVALV